MTCQLLTKHILLFQRKKLNSNILIGIKYHMQSCKQLKHLLSCTLKIITMLNYNSFLFCTKSGLEENCIQTYIAGEKRQLPLQTWYPEW